MDTPRLDTMLGETIDRLIEANLTLWHKEDERRDRRLSDADRLQAADEITIWNRKRNQIIDELNALFATRLTPDSDSFGSAGASPSRLPKEDNASQESATNVLLTGALGDLIDRLTIARIRRHHLEASGDVENAARLTQVLAEIEDLRVQIDQAFALAPHLSDKDRQRLLGFGKNKCYKDEA